MKLLNIVYTAIALAATPAIAQNEYFWTITSNITGTATAAWGDNQNQDVRVSTYSSGSWSDYEIIPGSSNTYPYPILIDMDAAGNIILVWADSSAGVILSSIKPTLGDWTTAEAISSDIDFSFDPVLSLDPGGNGFLVWLNESEGIQASHLPAGTTTWSAPVTLSQ